MAIDLTSNALALAFEPTARTGEGHGDERAAAPSGGEAATPPRDADAEQSPVARSGPATSREPRSAPVSRRRPTPSAAPVPSPPPDTPPTPEATPQPDAPPSPPAPNPAGATPAPVPGVAVLGAAFVPPGGDGARSGVIAAVATSAPPGTGRAGGSRGDGVGASRGSADGERRAVLLEYAREVRSRIAAQREYPYAARRARLRGTVCLRITLSSAGRLLAAEPTCGNSLEPLAQAALAAVTKASPFPPLPAPLGQRLTLDVPVVFELAD